MPIKFRCQYCRQLMGIARRKAGSMVDCTSCTKPVLVPFHDEPDKPRVPPPLMPNLAVPNPVPANSRLPMFERPDFEDQLTAGNSADVDQPQHSILGARVAPPVGTTDAQDGPIEYDVEPVDPKSLVPAPRGFVLDGLQVTLLALTMILLLLVAFGSGVVVGKYLL